MNYKVHFEGNKATHCELVKNINDAADYVIVNHRRVIKSLVVDASSEKEAIIVANNLIKKLLPE
ncbi:MAG: hypothetical protein ABJB05_11700 [Parafilimonas sp.]